jgi:predicted alpha/beta hydrolase family esterase
MSYGYNSGTAFSKAVTDVDDEAAILLDMLDGIRRSQDEKTRSIIFVAHSLGGIVVKKVCLVSIWAKPNLIYLRL